jgi:hypothetical protein
MKFKCVRIVPPLFSAFLLLTVRVALAGPHRRMLSNGIVVN